MVNVQELRREGIGRWEYPPIATHAPEFAQALPEGGTGRVEIIESLRWLKRGAGEGGAATHLVQIVNKPRQIVSLKFWHALVILLPIQHVAELIVKPG